MNIGKCPVCDLPLKQPTDNLGHSYSYDCKRCGNFKLSGSTLPILEATFVDNNDIKRAVLSHAIRKMQRANDQPFLKAETIERIFGNDSLPKPTEQVQNLILWLGMKAETGDATVIESCEALQAIIGGRSLDSIYYVTNELESRRLIRCERTDVAKATPPLRLQMQFAGWNLFEELTNQSIASRTVFMAMKFGEEELNNIVEKVFRPAVKQTGFELKVLSDDPKAGLIDDRLRVELRRCRFLLADVTHKNLGAYWEAGFAEGLGKPVIYTCKREVFTEVSHFDTNHLLTIMWDEDLERTREDLKAAIRATLPSEAKLDD